MDENLSDAQDRMQADKQYFIPSALSQDFSLENRGARSSPALLQTPGVMHTCAIGLTFLGEPFTLCFTPSHTEKSYS